ncbi:MAG: hypothetical protein KDD50_12765 [Bdellovibrionales bacterium]|nr:hypothetical protein [Bdellovibrionales bacterium]
MSYLNPPATRVLSPNEFKDVEFLWENGFGQANIYHQWGFAGCFAWGYEGDGPRDFAINILYHFSGNDKAFAALWANDFCKEVTSKISVKKGKISKDFILNWINERKNKNPSQPTTPDIFPDNGYARTSVKELVRKYYQQEVSI